MIKNKYTLLVLLALSACLRAGADSPEATAFNKLTLQMKKNKLSARECDDLQALREKEKQRQKDNENSHTEYEYDVIEYNLTIQNRGDIPLKGLIIECRYFYTEERQWRTKKTKDEEEQKHITCFLAESLEPRSKINLKTDPFSLESRELPSGYYYIGKWKGKAEVVEADPDGLWVKVRYEATDGSMMEKDFCDPKSLSSRVEWMDEEPKTASSKKSNKKNKK